MNSPLGAAQPQYCLSVCESALLDSPECGIRQTLQSRAQVCGRIQYLIQPNSTLSDLLESLVRLGANGQQM